MSQPWQPRYDPGAHQRRLDDGVPPQGYQPGYRQPPPQPWPPQQPQWQPGPHRRPPAKRKRGGGRVVFGVFCGIAAVIFIAIIAASHGSAPQPSPAATGASAPAVTASQAPPAAQTVTYVATGSSADVAYGPAGSDATGSVPMRKTTAIGTPATYYAISAQLNGGGSVSCKILVNGTVVSQATASGGYNIAQCEIVQDPLTGQWQDANSA